MAESRDSYINWFMASLAKPTLQPPTCVAPSPPRWESPPVSSPSELADCLREVAQLWSAGKIDKEEARRRGYRSMHVALESGALGAKHYGGLRKDLRSVFPAKMLDVTAAWFAAEGHTDDEVIADHHAMRRLAEAVQRLAAPVPPEVASSGQTAASQPPTMRPAGARRPSQGMAWQQAKQLAEEHCRRNAFPGVRALAKLVGCSSATMSKAIKNSPKLRQLKCQRGEVESALQVQPTSMQSAGPLEQLIAGESAQKEQQIANDPLVRRLLSESSPEERRIYLEDTPFAKLQELAETAYHDPERQPQVRRRSR